MQNFLQQESKSLMHILKGEKPQNGLKGLKYWKQDLLAGLVVSLVASPVSYVKTRVERPIFMSIRRLFAPIFCI
jgi:hypothetical protein